MILSHTFRRILWLFDLGGVVSCIASRTFNFMPIFVNEFTTDSTYRTYVGNFDSCWILGIFCFAIWFEFGFGGILVHFVSPLETLV